MQGVLGEEGAEGGDVLEGDSRGVHGQLRQREERRSVHLLPERDIHLHQHHFGNGCQGTNTHCSLSQHRFHFSFETFQSRLFVSVVSVGTPARFRGAISPQKASPESRQGEERTSHLHTILQLTR